MILDHVELMQQSSASLYPRTSLIVILGATSNTMISHAPFFYNGNM